MIEQTKFLGMPLRKQHQRRLLVVLYNVIVFGMGIFALWLGHKSWGPLTIQTLGIGGLLGGIKAGGPIKTYEESKLPLDMGSDVQTLNLSGKRPFSHLDWSPLDERERTQRDHAHYEAYRILRLTLGVAVIAYWISLNWTFMWLSTRGPILAWILLLYVLSLPQSVLLWTERDAAPERL
jgi:hypothetical protein